MKFSHLANPMLHQVLQELGETRLPMRQAYDVSRLIDTVREEFQRYDKLRLGLLDRFGTRDEGGQLVTDEQGNVQFPAENLGEFQAALFELQAIEIELPFQLTLASIESIQLSPLSVGLLVAAGVVTP